MEKVIVWFTNDLRLHDNETLFKALKTKAVIVPVYCFDERLFLKTSLGFHKTGSFRTQFLIETVTDLKQQLQSLGTDLLIRIGKPEVEIAKVAQNIKAKAVFASKETTYEELQVENSLTKHLKAIGCELNLFWQSTLLHPDDLPFSIQNIPDIFTEFRKSCEKNLKINTTFDTPQSITHFGNLTDTEIGNIPSIEQFGLLLPTPDNRAVLTFKGGETAALAQLNGYFWEKDLLKVYKETRNGLIGADYSSKFSAWLALGAISPRKIYEEIISYEAQRIKNESTYWLFFELLWRDYFRFIAKKYGNKLFLADGLKGNYQQLGVTDNKKAFEKWCNGTTGQPFVDANMLELQKTGFMSNRGRQNVASYLVKDLKVNWRWGAMYFESQLIDYDVCSNWGNWNYVAGIGNDPRENRYFNVAGQAQRYDAEGKYVKLWLGK